MVGAGQILAQDFNWPGKSTYLTKMTRIMANPKANVNPYPKLSIRTACLPFRRIKAPTCDITKPVMTGLITRLIP